MLLPPLGRFLPLREGFLPPQVCLTCCSRDVMVRVDQICHKHGVKFFTGDVFGYHGYMFANLGEHEFVE